MTIWKEQRIGTSRSKEQASWKTHSFDEINEVASRTTSADVAPTSAQRHPKAKISRARLERPSGGVKSSTKPIQLPNLNTLGP